MTEPTFTSLAEFFELVDEEGESSIMIMRNLGDYFVETPTGWQIVVDEESLAQLKHTLEINEVYH